MMNSKKKRYSLSEVIEFIETSMVENTASIQEENLYIDYKYNNDYIDTKKYLPVINKAIRKMDSYYNS